MYFFDLDKTLVDLNYRFTDDRIGDAVQRAVNRGHVIGLNSDTPVPSLLLHYRRLGMNGPIVAERGAVVWFPGEDMTHATGSAPDDEFVLLRDRVLRRVTADGSVEAILGDPSGIIRARRFWTDGSTPVLLASALRTHSLHFAARRMVGTDYAFDMDLLERVRVVAREEMHKHNVSVPVEWDFNPEYAVLILHAAASRKAVGVKYVLERLGIGEAVMVGDGAVDNLNLSRVRQWAVGNASEEYRSVCERVAVGTFPAGAIELLDSLS